MHPCRDDIDNKEVNSGNRYSNLSHQALEKSSPMVQAMGIEYIQLGIKYLNIFYTGGHV